MFNNTVYLKFFFLLVAVITISQLARIQVLENSKWSLRAELRDVVSIRTEGQRGQISFRDGSPIAYDKQVFRIFINPIERRNDTVDILPEEIYLLIKDYTQLSEKDLIKELESNNQRRVLITRDLNEAEFVKVFSLFGNYPDLISYDQLFVREYPNKLTASKAVGFVGYDDNGIRVGRYGVEEYFDGVLKGTPGVIEGKKDQKGNLIIDERFSSVRPRDGINLKLTIDQAIQKKVDEKLIYWLDKFKAVEATAIAIEPGTGRILAISNFPTYDPNLYYEGESVDCELEYYVLHKDCNPKKEGENLTKEDKDEVLIERGLDAEGELESEKKNNGESELILPEGLVLPDGYTEEEIRKILIQINELNETSDEDNEIINQDDMDEIEEEKETEIDPRIEKYEEIVREVFREEDIPIGTILRNTPNSFLYEPGSVVKAFTLSAALEYNTIPYDGEFQLGGHNGCIMVAEREICTANKKPRSSLSLKEMIVESDNIGALRVAQTVKIKDFVEKFEEFGLGSITNVEMADENQFKSKPSSEWTKLDQVTASFGQGSVAYTPLQLVNAWNIIASGGVKYKPTIIYAKDDGEGDEIFSPVNQGRVIREEVANAVSNLTSSDPGYNGMFAKDFYDKYTYAGKTGTASVPKTDGVGYRDGVVNTTFVGHAPKDNPEVTLLVWFREPRISDNGSLIPNASDTALVAWTDIMEQIMIIKGIKPNN